jgi:hypothetical protein
LENLKGRDHSEDLGIDGKIIRIDLREMQWEGMDSLCLAQDRDQQQALVNMVINVWVP